MTGSTPVRLRAAAVAVRDDHVLLVLRERAGRRYAVLPGGGVEPGETPLQACLRELREETGLDGALVALLPVGLDRAAPAVYLHVEAGPGVPALATNAPERAGASPT
ncbi:MAG: NUDIX domain-containing protein, partial [Curtobacterium sp.]